MYRPAIQKILPIALLAVASGCAHLQESGAPVEAVGYFEGDWYGPNPNQPLGALSCTIVPGQNGHWDATFFATFGGVGEYEVALQGRRDGEAILFQGSVDLGATSGGVFDWNGSIVGDEFLGSYTSKAIRGTFKMKRAPYPTH